VYVWQKVLWLLLNTSICLWRCYIGIHTQWSFFLLLMLAFIACTTVLITHVLHSPHGILYRRRVGPEALPCFEVPRHKGGSLSDGCRKTRKGLWPYPFPA
jgi:hypothetical protein